MFWDKASVELFPGWMVDMVELGESGCYEVKSVFRCLMAEWWRWLSSEREGLIGQSLCGAASWLYGGYG